MTAVDQSTPQSSCFYIAGGTLRRDAPSYVVRKADTDLLDGLLAGQFCYVLDTRQMGKSSLVVRTAERLRAEGVTVAILDLTELGQDLSREQWYYGLLRRLGDQIGLLEPMAAFWRQNKEMGPLQRWMAAIRQVALPTLSPTLVIFVDEIDAVRSLPFSTDEFFAGIRACYNQRVEDPVFERLTFCLLGVTTPADLIREVMTTPFNIGRRIELNDFTPEEAAPLALGLNHRGTEAQRDHRETNQNRTGEALLKRILYWTGGHPYLTQRLCQAVAEEGSVRSTMDVDRICAAIFLSRTAREVDDNLAFVRNRLLKSEADVASVLDLYAQIRVRHRRVKDDPANPLVSILHLSGIVRTMGGSLWVRNRIYHKVFEKEWIRANMPDAELRRQKEAYRKATLRTASLFTVILIVIVSLAVQAYKNARQAEQWAKNARYNASKEAVQRQLAEQRLYAGDMSLAQRAWEAGNISRVVELLDELRPQPGQPDWRGFEWRYYWKLCHSDLFTYLHNNLSSLAFSSDSKMLAMAYSSTYIILLHLHTWTWEKIDTSDLLVEALTFSLDGKTLVLGGGLASDNITSHSPGAIQLLNVQSKQRITNFKGRFGRVMSVSFLRDGKTLLSMHEGGVKKRWDIQSKRELASSKSSDLGVATGMAQPLGSRWFSKNDWGILAFLDTKTKQKIKAIIKKAINKADWLFAALSPNRKMLATSTWNDNIIKLWDIATGHLLVTFKGRLNPITYLEFSPDSHMLASGTQGESEVNLWNITQERNPIDFRCNTNPIEHVAFSLDGKIAATGDSKTVTLWNLTNRQNLGSILDAAVLIALSPDGKLLADLRRDGSVAVFDVFSKRKLAEFQASSRIGSSAFDIIQSISALSFSLDSKILAVLGENIFGIGSIKLFDIERKKELRSIKLDSPTTLGMAFCPEGRSLAIDGGDRIWIWDMSKEKFKRTLASIREQNPDPIPTESSDIACSPEMMAVVRGGTIFLSSLSSTSLQKPVPLKGNQRSITCMTFSPDGKTLATGSNDHTITLWNLTSQSEVATFKDSDSVLSLMFSPDGTTLYSGSANGTITIRRAASLAEADRRYSEQTAQ